MKSLSPFRSILLNPSTKTLSVTSSFFFLSRKFVTKVPSFPPKLLFSQFKGIRSFATEVSKVPNLGDSITSATVVSWQKNVGDQVQQDEVIMTLETDKVSVEIRAPAAGALTKQLVKEGDTVAPGDSLAEIDTATSVATPSKPADEPSKPSISSSAPVQKAQPEQYSRGAAEKDSSSTPSPKATSGVGPSSQQFNAAPSSSSAPPPPASPPSKSTSPISFTSPTPGSRSERRVPMSRMRQTIASRLKMSQNVAASLTTFNEIDMTNLMEMRSKFKDEFLEKTGIKLGFMSAFVKAATGALLRNPDVNAYIEENTLVYHDYVDVSVAVSTPTGLVVPVLRNTENMSFAQIEAAIASLGQKARKGQIAIEDMVGGTFTISNGGVYGSLFGTPILNPPQSAILGMHGIFKRPVVVHDKVEIRPMMYVALTYDHRIIDGGTAVTFLKDVKAGVEDPTRLLLNF